MAACWSPASSTRMRRPVTATWSTSAARRGRNFLSSFRGDAKHRTRNLEIPGLVLAHHPGMTMDGDAPMPWLEPTTLYGTHARLEPLSQDHCDGLTEAVKDGELWKLWYTSVPSAEGMRKEIDRRLGLQTAG